MRLGRVYLVILFAAAVEAILNFRILCVRPEIVLVALVFFSLKVDQRNSFFLGCFAGFLKDIVSLSPFGLHLLIFGAVSLLLNRSRKFFYEIPEYLSIVAASIVLTIYSLIFLIVKSYVLGSILNAKIIFFAIWVVVVNVLLTPLVFRAIKLCASR